MTLVEEAGSGTIIAVEGFIHAARSFAIDRFPLRAWNDFNCYGGSRFAGAQSEPEACAEELRRVNEEGAARGWLTPSSFGLCCGLASWLELVSHLLLHFRFCFFFLPTHFRDASALALSYRLRI